MNIRVMESRSCSSSSGTATRHNSRNICRPSTSTTGTSIELVPSIVKTSTSASKSTSARSMTSTGISADASAGTGAGNSTCTSISMRHLVLVL